MRVRVIKRNGELKEESEMKNCDLVIVSSLVVMLLLLFSVAGFHLVREMGEERESARAGVEEIDVGVGLGVEVWCSNF